jgi:hypothetical protein
MSDYIERDLLLAEIKELKKSPWYNGGYGTYERNIRREAIDIIVDLCIRSAPAADVQEIKHGEWIEDSYYDIPCVCSCCGAEAQYTSTFKETFDYDWEKNLCPTGYEEIREYIKTPFCSNCGAKMDGKEVEGE